MSSASVVDVTEKIKHEKPTHALLYLRSRKSVQNVDRYTNTKANQCSGEPCGKFVKVNLEKEVNPGRAAAAAFAALAAFVALASVGEWKARVELEAAAAAAAAAAELRTPCFTPCPRMFTGRRTKRATSARGKKICFELCFFVFERGRDRGEQRERTRGAEGKNRRESEREGGKQKNDQESRLRERARGREGF